MRRRRNIVSQATGPRQGQGHLFISVKSRRWCLGCDLFQQASWHGFPVPRWDCTWSTPYAHAHPDERPEHANRERTPRYRGMYKDHVP